ncbi:hypothetical protein R1sor_001888 [Riccia sorocarpa]|uniref:Uncharacterized protein n=1 Tax=Riccia sorocarpa TaxID=122646 RepID=A0ABD3GZ76_9MARC
MILRLLLLVPVEGAALDSLPVRTISLFMLGRTRRDAREGFWLTAHRQDDDSFIPSLAQSRVQTPVVGGVLYHGSKYGLRASADQHPAAPAPAPAGTFQVELPFPDIDGYVISAENQPNAFLV